MPVYHTDGGLVAAYPPQEGDCWVETLIDGGDGVRRSIALDPIDQWQAAVDAAIPISRQMSGAIHIVALSPADLTQILGPRLENGLRSMTDQERGELRRCVVNAMCEVLRDCPDPATRAEAYDVLKSMKVIRP